ncbi:CREB-regulated transcription coactivator 1-like isoform X3 [Amphibalanus amphitrite]|uniref:CREB-regulated transcription coactivator 1-like isoform X3 n=1 Tax=Amphibalanus amphitrite TaxID=1232801 RepID=UPI001C900404|nr:CREB-regulated transcription coactivator 1-like isoform X3 [Amphibalanus amphitrite]
MKVYGKPSAEMANPRKFSEKIALHNQKQAEETAAFEKIMREVGVAVPKGSPGMSSSGPQPVAASPAGLLQPFYRGCGGSLPNVNQMAGYPLPPGPAGYQDPHGMVQGSQPSYSPDQRTSGFGPQRNPRAVCDHRRETSPYSPPGQTFLTPPSDSGWRRTHSDSALHRTLQQSECYSPSLQRRAGGGSGGGGLHEVPGSGGSSPAPPPGHWNPFDPKLGHVPVSCAQPGDQRVPGPPGALLADGRPPLNGLAPAGSLPDLTPGGYPAPRAARSAQDGDDLSRTPPYSPVYGDPSSPGQHPASHTIPPRPASQNRLSVPHPGGAGGFLSSFKTAAAGPQSPGMARKAPFPAPFGADGQQPQQQQPPPLSPDPMAAFRTPRVRQRSVSPQPFCQPGYSPPSPLDGGFPSSPSSPAAQSPASTNSFYTAPQAHQMQRQFEQFNMGISPTVTVPSGQPMLASGDMSQQSTPLTPTSSIPEITLSDFSSASALQQQELLRDMRDANDILQGSGDNFDAEDLGELDLEGLQMLTNPDGHVIDASSDDYFRMESLGGP